MIKWILHLILLRGNLVIILVYRNHLKWVYLYNIYYIQERKYLLQTNNGQYESTM